MMLQQLRKDVEYLAAPGTRKVGSYGHEQAKQYLTSRMKQEGLIPYQGTSFELSYEVDTSNYTNLAGVLPGRDRELTPLLFVAHYDTCGDQPGADDNAAAISIWFAVLNLLKQHGHERDIIFLFPDAEEPPFFLTEHMGSTNFYKNQFAGSIHAGIVLDLVGHDVPIDGMEDLVFIFGAESHQTFSEVIIESPLPAGLRNIATLNRYVGDLSDHHVLRKSNQPYLFFTCGRWQHYHQTSDKPEYLNYEKMGRITEYLFTLIKRILAAEFDADGLRHDPIDFELQLIRRAIGPYLDQHAIPMEDRNDLQKFVLNWVNQYQL